MSTLIIGSEGSQGKRYQAILKHLDKPYAGYDQRLPEFSALVETFPRWQDYSSFIIASPTDTHASFIRQLLPYGKPILCEKPITKNIYEMRDLFEEIRRAGTPFSMVYQYRHLVLADSARGHSHYNYFRHGNDGLIWDCLQIIGLSKECVSLYEDSPIWQCEINGRALSIKDMDKAYVTEVLHWLRGRGMSDLKEILAIHERVNSFAEQQSAYRK